MSYKRLGVLALVCVLVLPLLPAQLVADRVGAHPTLGAGAEGAASYPSGLSFGAIEFFGDYSRDYPLRATLAGDPYSLDFYDNLDQARSIYAMYHAMGMKVILYRAFSSLSENPAFMDYWNLSKEEVSPMDLNGTYWVALPYTIGYEGRDAWRAFFVKFV